MTVDHLPPEGHALLRDAPLGSISFAGHSLPALARIAGRTPCYVYDRTLIRRRVAWLRAALPETVRVHYSLKANPLPAVVHALSGTVDGLDVASQSELRCALGSGLDPSSISFSGPGKSDGELAAALAVGATIHAESAGELERIARLADTDGRDATVALRVNPDFVIRRSGMTMGGGSRPFGIDAERMPECFERARALGLEVTGLHCYAASQVLDVPVAIDMLTGTLELLSRLAAEHCLRQPTLNLGGGFGIPYFQHETALDVRCVGAALHDALEVARRRCEFDRCALELGRWIVGPAGLYLCRVVDRKRSRGRDYLVLDGGMNHHLAASGNLGQVVRRNYPVVGCREHDGSRAPMRPDAPVAHVVGPLCTPLDVLADDAPLADLREGDLVAVLQSGAYGASASPQGFLGHAPPVEILL